MHHQSIPSLLLALVTTVFAGVASSQAPPKKSLESIRADDITAHVKILASDEYEGRMPGTRGEEKTLDYITKQLRAYGIAPQPGGGALRADPPRTRRPA